MFARVGKTSSLSLVKWRTPELALASVQLITKNISLQNNTDLKCLNTSFIVFTNERYF